MFDRERLLTILRSTSNEGRARLLALIALELTVHARGTYASDSRGVADPLSLRAYAEGLHFLMGILVTLLSGEELDCVSLAQSLELLTEHELIGQTVGETYVRAFKSMGLD
jgi:hypothetical protein